MVAVVNEDAVYTYVMDGFEFKTVRMEAYFFHNNVQKIYLKEISARESSSLTITSSIIKNIYITISNLYENVHTNKNIIILACIFRISMLLMFVC